MSLPEHVYLQPAENASGVAGQAMWWCFTLNNYSDAEVLFIQRWIERGDDFACDYVVFQREVGAEGTHHLQGCAKFKKRVRLSELKRLTPRAHWGITRSIAKAVAYCKKAESRLQDTEPWEGGEYKNQGHRTDLSGLKQALDDRWSYGDMVDTYFEPMAKHYKFVEKEIFRRAEVRDFKSFVVALTGASGWGKTRMAHDFCKQRGVNLYVMSPGNGQNMWLDNYQSGDALLIDDFRGGILGQMFLQMLDRYALQVECKGGKINFNPPIIFITSNRNWTEWYDSEKVDQRAIERRIDVHIKCYEGTPYHLVKSGGDGDVPCAEVACNTGGHFGRLPTNGILSRGYDQTLEFLTLRVGFHGHPVDDDDSDNDGCGEAAQPAMIPESPTF